MTVQTLAHAQQTIQNQTSKHFCKLKYNKVPTITSLYLNTDYRERLPKYMQGPKQTLRPSCKSPNHIPYVFMSDFKDCILITQ